MNETRYDVLREFVEERNAFLCADNPTPEFVRAFFHKWNPGMPAPKSDLACLGAFYKARLGWEYCPPDKRQEAIGWLTEHGFTLEL